MINLLVSGEELIGSSSSSVECGKCCSSVSMRSVWSRLVRSFVRWIVRVFNRIRIFSLFIFIVAVEFFRVNVDSICRSVTIESFPNGVFGLFYRRSVGTRSRSIRQFEFVVYFDVAEVRREDFSSFQSFQLVNSSSIRFVHEHFSIGAFPFDFSSSSQRFVDRTGLKKNDDDWKKNRSMVLGRKWRRGTAEILRGEFSGLNCSSLTLEIHSMRDRLTRSTPFEKIFNNSFIGHFHLHGAFIPSDCSFKPRGLIRSLTMSRRVDTLDSSRFPPYPSVLSYRIQSIDAHSSNLSSFHRHFSNLRGLELFNPRFDVSIDEYLPWLDSLTLDVEHLTSRTFLFAHHIDSLTIGSRLRRTDPEVFYSFPPRLKHLDLSQVDLSQLTPDSLCSLLHFLLHISSPELLLLVPHSSTLNECDCPRLFLQSIGPTPAKFDRSCFNQCRFTDCSTLSEFFSKQIFKATTTTAEEQRGLVHRRSDRREHQPSTSPVSRRTKWRFLHSVATPRTTEEEEIFVSSIGPFDHRCASRRQSSRLFRPNSAKKTARFSLEIKEKTRHPRIENVRHLNLEWSERKKNDRWIIDVGSEKQPTDERFVLGSHRIQLESRLHSSSVSLFLFLMLLTRTSEQYRTSEWMSKR